MHKNFLIQSDPLRAALGNHRLHYIKYSQQHIKKHQLTTIFVNKHPFTKILEDCTQHKYKTTQKSQTETTTSTNFSSPTVKSIQMFQLPKINASHNATLRTSISVTMSTLSTGN